MNMTSIRGKKVLFFSPAFFNYENIIVKKMREMGAQADMYDVRSVVSPVSRAILKIFPNIFKRKTEKYYEKIIGQNRGKDYDFILFVKCDMTPISILQRMRVEYPNAKICLNLWDSVENIPGIIEKFKYFDTLHSFDLNDCERYPDLKFRPLFFSDQFRKKEKQNNEYKYDISFIGTIHSDRYAVIKKIQKIISEQGLKGYWFLYLQSKFIYWFYRAIKSEFKGIKKATFSFDKMSSTDIAKVVDASKIILDIQHPRQTGLTMRTIEMVGMNKKIITTNESIKNYDFYDPQNINVINRKNVELDLEFLNSSYKPISIEIYEKYSLKNWILEVLN